MADSLELKAGIGRKDLRAVRERFLGIHRDRLHLILAALPPGQQGFIEILPLLFHLNYPLLPGFVHTNTPAGISGYQPSRQSIHAALRLSRSFRPRATRLQSTPILGIYLMGSSGTIGHSGTSDFDIWLVHDSSLEQKDIAELQRKIDKIERWARDLHMQVHIFPMDPEGFRKGNRSALSGESSGSTQHALLLEEFYRSGLLLAGLPPLWWFVPPEEEHNYREFTRMLIERRFITPGDYLDFGGLEQVAADEFFGAARWHLYKGIDSPYKSVLKILLMEAYAKEYPSPNWLAQQAKALIYSGVTSQDKLDAYVLMYRHVERHLQRHGQPLRLDLARRCLYFKAELHLSRAQEGDWRTSRLRALTKEWGWNMAQLVTLDARPQWKINKVQEERKALVRELSQSYRILTQFSRKHGQGSTIDPAELNLLGRKLYATMEHRPGKIDSINPGISDDLLEPHLTLVHKESEPAVRRWSLYRDPYVGEELAPDRCIKTAGSLMELLAWCHINDIANTNSIFYLHQQALQVSQDELRSLLQVLRKALPAGNMPRIPLEALKHAAHTVSTQLFVNIGQDPMESLSREGKQLTSNRSDALSFGSAHINLVQSLERLSVNSWGELLVQRYEDSGGLMDALCDHLNSALGPTASIHPAVNAYCFSSVKGTQIAQRITELFNEAVNRLAEDPRAHFVCQVQNAYFVITAGDKGYYWLRQETEDDLLDELGQPQAVFRQVLLDRTTLAGTLYPAIFACNRPGSIQVFYEVRERSLGIYVLDEHGALFRDSASAANLQHSLQHYHRFFESMQRHYAMVGAEGCAAPREPQYYRMVRTRAGSWLAESLGAPRGALPDYLELRLLSHIPADPGAPYSLICGDAEFASLEHGIDTFREAARHVLGLRRSTVNYPVYLTAIASVGTEQPDCASGVELLRMKQRAEARLNQALTELQPSP